MSPTYGLGVLAGRGGVVVVVAGGDIGVGVAPLVLNPRSPGVTLHLMPVLRPGKKYNKIKMKKLKKMKKMKKKCSEV